MLGMKPFGALGAGGRGGGGLGRRAALFLDFVNGMYTVNRQRRALADIMTIAGGVNGTRVNEAGLIEAASAPRFDYDPVTLAARGVLVEEQRANILQYSSDFTMVWASDANRGTITPNATTSPDGTITAGKLVAGSDNNAYRFQFPPASASTAYSTAIYVKQAEAPFSYNEPANTTGLTFYDLSNGAVTAVATGATGAFGRAAGNGWYRTGVTSTTSGAATTALLNFGLSDVSGSQPCTPGDGGFFWGADVQAGSFMTSHIPTGASAVTRTPDSLTMTGTDFSSWWNQAGGTIVVKMRRDVVGLSNGAYFPRLFFISDGTTDNAIDVQMNDSNTSVVLTVRVGAATVLNEVFAGAVTGENTVSVRYGSGQFSVSVNGQAFVTHSATVPTGLSEIRFGDYPGGIAQLNGHIQKFVYSP